MHHQSDFRLKSLFYYQIQPSKKESPLMMQRLLFFAVLLFSFTTYSQYQISGIIKDSITNAPLAFANIHTQNGIGSITDREGNFTLEQNTPFTSITISYVGYTEKNILVTPNKSYYTILLDQDVAELDAVVIEAQDKAALQIIQKTIAAKPQNNPEKALHSFEFTSYSKLLVTVNPDSISQTIDTVYKIENGHKKLLSIDSTDYELKKQMKRSHLYISEKVSDYKFNQQSSLRENVLATRMAGLEEPVYRALAIQMQSFSFYDDTYAIFGTEYTNPITHAGTKKYDYKILDTIHANRDAFLIHYKEKNSHNVTGLEGVLYIDTATFGLQKAVAQLKGRVTVNAVQNFTYFKEENIWFPSSKSLLIKKGENEKIVSLFGGKVNIKSDERLTQNDSTKIYTNTDDSAKHVYMILNETNSNIQINTPVHIKGKGLKLAFEEDAYKKNEAFWNRYRTDSITSRDTETYTYIDSIAQAENLQKNIAFLMKLLNGYWHTNYIDLDLRYLVKYNNYEGFRLGMGAITNRNFSTKYRINGYGVYGTLDKEFKFGLGVDARVNRLTNTWIGAMYSDDVQETGSHPFITDGRAFYVFQPRLFNITTFQKKRNINIHLSHNITSKARLKIQLDKNDVMPTYDYVFNVNDTSYKKYNTTSATAAINWQPKSTFMLTPKGFDQIKRGFPTFTFQATQAFSGLLNGSFNFTKLNFRTYYEIQPLRKGKTIFQLNSGFAFGELPLQELYHTNPNSPNKYSIMRRFSVAGIDNFETMYFNEFYSDRFLTLQARHEFLGISLGKRSQPQFSVFSKFAIGDVKNIERHQQVTFSSLDQGYLESGFEINKILFGFGLSAAYRYGYYHLPNFDDNISFKFTYNFNINL